MKDHIFYLLIMWGGAFVLLGFGIYVRKMKKPMRLWTTIPVLASDVKDLSAYNREISRRWCICSFPCFITGLIVFCYPVASVIFFVLSCTAGIAWIAWQYQRIEKKYLNK
mgnify:FL=1